MRPSAASASRPPGPPGLPLLGVALDYSRDPFDFLLRTAREHGDIAYLKLGGYDIYQVCDPELIAQVLVHKRARYRKNQFLRKARVLFGDGLLTAEGEDWRRKRRLAQPAFTTRAVMGYVATMSGRAQAHIARWSDGDVRDLHQDMMRLTLDIALGTLFGAELDEGCAAAISRSFSEATSYFAGLRTRPVALPLWMPTPGNRRFLNARSTLFAVIDDLVEQRRARQGPAECLLDMLLSARGEDGEGYDRQQLRAELVTLLFAGHETTALGLTFALWHLARAPEVAAALSEEAQAVLGEAAPAAEHLPALKATDRALREALRLHPPSYAIGREALEEDELGGWTIPAGSMVVLPQWVVHRDPRLYEAPEQFMPERWTSEFKASLPTFGWFPFGGGPRVCVGAGFAMVEMSLTLATILRRWRLEPVDDAPLRLAAATTARPIDPVRARLVSL
ncbi:MAG: cytochrome P450 [Alphaproteobacteria bacterium]|nr:cytochrome P450 [Alphaproteobacteria bacterium]